MNEILYYTPNNSPMENVHFKTVFRIEHSKTGLGVYMHEDENYTFPGGCFATLKNMQWDNFEWKPEPRQETIMDKYCAFKSFNDLKEHTSKWMELFLKNNFRVFKLEISIWGESDYQVIFDPKHVITKQDITSQFEAQR